MADLDDTIEAIRVASFESPKAQSATEWRARIAKSIAERDRMIFNALLRADTNSSGFTGSGPKAFLALLSGAHMAWMKLVGLRLEIYVYSAEEGEKVVEALKRLGVSDAVVDSFDHWHDGMTHIVKGSL